MTDSHNFQYYLQCLFGGSLACGITHTAITTLDLLKCLKQVDPTKFKSFSQGFHQIYQQRGVKGLITGWSPTLIGYSQQGLFKYGLYEVFKDFYAKSAEDKLEQYKVLGYALSSASAELVADLFLCPWESVKVRMQTQVFGKFPGKLRPAMRQIYAEEGLKGFYKGLIPLWSRQIPYTVAKFVFFEEIISFFYGHVFNSRPKDQYSTSLQLMVTFTSGYLAGIICAIVSHPADTIMSWLNNHKTEGGVFKNMRSIYKDIGFWGLWSGLLYRIMMIGTLTGFQWWIYDSYKSFMGLKTSGGSYKK